MMIDPGKVLTNLENTKSSAMPTSTPMSASPTTSRATSNRSTSPGRSRSSSSCSTCEGTKIGAVKNVTGTDR